MKEVTMKSMINVKMKSHPDFKLFRIDQEKLDYWNALSVEDKNYYIGWGEEETYDDHHGYKTIYDVKFRRNGVKLQAMMIDEAWNDSTTAKERRRTKSMAEEHERENELLTCSRTGNKVAAKYCLVMGGIATSFDALNPAEREFLDIA